MLKVAHGELVWNRDGVEIIWQPRYSVYEVWAPIADGPDDFTMDMIADCADDGKETLTTSRVSGKIHAQYNAAPYR